MSEMSDDIIVSVLFGIERWIVSPHHDVPPTRLGLLVTTAAATAWRSSRRSVAPVGGFGDQGHGRTAPQPGCHLASKPPASWRHDEIEDTRVLGAEARWMAVENPALRGSH